MVTSEFDCSMSDVHNNVSFAVILASCSPFAPSDVPAGRPQDRTIGTISESSCGLTAAD